MKETDNQSAPLIVSMKLVEEEQTHAGKGIVSVFFNPSITGFV